VTWRRNSLVILLASLALWAVVSPACREAPPVLRVGCQGDTEFRRSVGVALALIKQSGSPVRLEVVNDATGWSTPASVVRAAEGFCRDPDIHAVVGFSSSDSSLAAARMLSRHKIPLVTPTATSPKLLDSGPWTFRLLPNDAHQARFMADAAWRRLGARRCAVVYQNNDYGRELASLFQDEFQCLGGEIVRTALTGSGQSRDFPPRLYISGIVESTPDLLVLICQPKQAELVHEELTRLGMTLPILASDSLSTRKALGDLVHMFEGMNLSLFYHPDLPHRGNDTFAEEYRRQVGLDPGYEAALVFDALMLLHQAVLEGARTREDIRTYLEKLSGESTPFQGVTGPILFNHNNEVERPLHLGLIRDGALLLRPPAAGSVGGDQ